MAQKNSDDYINYMNQLLEYGSIKDLNAKEDKLEKQIDKICDSAIRFLNAYKNDTTITDADTYSYGLIKVFTSEKDTYQEQIGEESELVFMSYGKVGKEERKMASAGYYYFALKAKYKFLKAMYDNAKDNLDPFGKY